MTAFEAVLLGRSSAGGSFFRLASAADLARVEETMRLCRCWELRGRELATLSGGERQLVALARALAQDAKILLLDEALSRMDLHHQAAMGRLLSSLCRDQGYAVILVAHDLNLAAEWASSALLLREGRRVGFGPLREVLTEEALGLLYPGAPLSVVPHPQSGAPRVFFRG
jgi:iron complex transport system ATP-binding protein